MTDRDQLGATLEALVPRFDEEPHDWDDVLRRAEAVSTPAPRRRLGRRRAAAAALAVLAALAAILLVDPFPSHQKGVLDRALAAVGRGPVLHVVTRSGSVGTLVDLDSGQRARVYVKSEVWFDPRRGERMTVRVRGAVLEDSGVPRKRLRPGGQSLAVFTRDYRAALRSGRAHVLRKGVLAGKPVYWIRVEAGPRVRRPGPCSRFFCTDVAVSRRTYKPLYLRWVGGPGQWILKVESLAAGTGEIPGPRHIPLGWANLPRRSVDRSAAERLLGARLGWPGRRIAGLDLARMTALGSRPFRFNGHMPRPRWGRRNRVIRLEYRRGDRVLVINEAGRAGPGLTSGPVRVREESQFSPLFYVPPEGSMLLTAHGRRAVLRQGGLALGVLGSTPELVLAAVRTLRR